MKLNPALILHHRKYKRLHLSGKKKLLYRNKHNSVLDKK